ncbi:UNKNOWN [Stylonychia lemnae]|uniref:Uncharacterized protein n=1 Tax=Stylonychia lemnae TaxID=5949 RepID=A0A078A8J8_STYLE|nr:UNKNOWN [Stylonychia lemnae]|eukprot:CDW78201.1 UNKNOWN [Stylonychia lemnae]
MKVNDAFRPPSAVNHSKPKVTTLQDGMITWKLTLYQRMSQDQNKKTQDDRLRSNSDIKKEPRNGKSASTHKYANNNQIANNSTIPQQQLNSEDIYQSSNQVAQQYSAKSRQPSIKHSKSTYQMLRQESNIFQSYDEVLSNQNSMKAMGNKKNESNIIFDITQDKNSNIDDVQLRKSDINANGTKSASVSPSKNRHAMKQNNSIGVYGAMSGKADQDEESNQRKSISMNRKNQSVLSKVLEHYDGADPARTHNSVTRDPLDKDQLMTQQATKRYGKYGNDQSKSTILNNQGETEDQSNDQSMDRERSKSRANKRNDSSFNVISGTEKTPQRVVLHKKMFNIDVQNPIVFDQSADINDTDFGDNNLKSYGQGVSFVSKPEQRIQAHQQTINPQKQKTQIYFEQEDPQIMSKAISQSFHASQTPVTKKSKVEFQTPIKDENQSQTVRAKNTKVEQMEPLFSKPKGKTNNEDFYGKDQNMEVYKQKQQQLEQQQLRVAQSFADIIGEDNAKKTHEQKQKLQEENKIMVAQQLFNNQRNGRENEKSKLMNDERINDTIIDTMTGDPRKKMFEAREGSRSRSRSQIKTFQNDMYTDNKCVMQNQDNRPLICDDEQKISQRNNDLKRLSSDLKVQITKRLEYLKAEKERIKQQEQESIEVALRIEADDKEKKYVQKVESKHIVKAQMILQEKQKDRQKSQSKIEKMQERDLVRQIQQRQVLGSVLAVGKYSGEADIIVANRDNKNVSASNSFVFKSDQKLQQQSNKNLHSMSKSKTPNKSTQPDDSRTTPFKTPDTMSTQKKVSDKQSVNGNRKAHNGYNQVRAQVLNYSDSSQSNNGFKRSYPKDQLVDRTSEFTFKNKFNE